MTRNSDEPFRSEEEIREALDTLTDATFEIASEMGLVPTEDFQICLRFYFEDGICKSEAKVERNSGSSPEFDMEDDKLAMH